MRGATRRWVLGTAATAALAAGGVQCASSTAPDAPRVRTAVVALPSPVRLAEPRPSPTRASRTRPPALAPQPPTGAAQWATSRDAVRVANCESGDLMHWPWSDGTVDLSRPGLHDQPTYTGKWQIGPGEWASWGGLQYASAPYLASEAEQDAVAYSGWLRRGWQPWVCARKLGVA